VRREKQIAAGERALTGCRCGGEREAEKSEAGEADCSRKEGGALTGCRCGGEREAEKSEV
jgi:hypothetical protein